jgi:flagellar biosynthetic protein FliR
MISFTSEQLNVWLGAFLWPFIRIMALISTAPIFDQPNVPNTVKIGLAAILTVIISPLLGTLPAVNVGSAAGILIIAQQILIGASMGLVMQVVFAAVEGAGEFAGLQMGLGFAQLITPTAVGGETLVLANLLNVFCTLVFLAIDGHLRLISALMESFTTLPISTVNLQAHGFETIAAWGGAIFSGGLMLCMPIVAVILMANISVGILNRAAPQIGVYQVGFAITLLVGVLMLDFTLPNIIPYIVQLTEEGFNVLFTAIAGFGGYQHI